MVARLVNDAGKAIDSAIVSEKALDALTLDRLRLLRALGEPKYPAEVARELGMQVQTCYYHIRLLKEAGLIELVEYEEKQGGMAKKFKAAADALSFVVNEKWQPYAAPHSKTPLLFKPFISGNHFDARIVLGSPEPHGRYRARASEFCATELAMYLGNFAAFSFPLFYLDTEVKEKNKRENLVLFGGPKVNMVVDEINSFLPVKFEEKTFAIKSSLSGRRYEEDVGLIELVENPFNKAKKILLLAGSNHNATRVAVLALLTHRSEVEKGNAFDRNAVAKVVRGFDEDGDGIADAIEMLE